MVTAPEEVIRFLKRRYASAIACGDERTATRLRTQLDRLLNGSAAAERPGDALTEGSEHHFPELPPAA